MKNLRRAKWSNLAIIIASSIIVSGCNSSSSDEKEEVSQVTYTHVSQLGGDATAVSASDSGHGFSTPMPNLTTEQLDKHLAGDAHFETAFTTAPNSEHPELDGLGPERTKSLL